MRSSASPKNPVQLSRPTRPPLCTDLCPRDVYDVDKSGIPIVARLSDCNACMFCELHCPDFAIRVRASERDGAALVGAGEEAV